jgi:hypothetical protein
LDSARHRKSDRKTNGVVFVEVCDDEELLEENYRYKISSGPDFDGMPAEEALADCRARVKRITPIDYEQPTISMSYGKVFNLRRRN